MVVYMDVYFEWDDDKDQLNQKKHGVSFETAQRAFDDPYGVIARDQRHGKDEKRYFCFGRVDDKILTVRFSFRNNGIRIFGAGYWRKGKKYYEQENKIHR